VGGLVALAKILPEKQLEAKGTVAEVQVVEYLPTKHKDLS
jgi:hypothetical protein